MTTTLAIDVFSDVVCPWCFIGATRLEQALAAMATELRAEVCFHPFYLDPTVPEGGVSVPDMLKQKYGVEPKQVWARAEAAARESGLDLDLSLQPRMYPTSAAHTLLRHAHAKGTQAALAQALFHGYFREVLDISDETVLAGIAVRHGFTAEEARALVKNPSELELTREEAAAAAQNGIRGVPFFIFGGRLAVSGAQPMNVLQGAIRQALAEAAPSGAPPAP
jgi:predicted DsbA family dithiol-disulfide isomerase